MKAIIIILLISSAAYADGMDTSFGKPQSTEPERTVSRALDEVELARYQYCSNDSDCVYAVNGCCDCANGGENAAVNIKNYAEFRSRFKCQRVACTYKTANPVCGSGVVSCISNRCKYFDGSTTP